MISLCMTSKIHQRDEHRCNMRKDRYPSHVPFDRPANPSPELEWASVHETQFQSIPWDSLALGSPRPNGTALNSNLGEASVQEQEEELQHHTLQESHHPHSGSALRLDQLVTHYWYRLQLGLTVAGPHFRYMVEDTKPGILHQHQPICLVRYPKQRPCWMA